MSRVLLAGLALALLLPASASARDRAGTALNIIPNGQYGAVPAPPGADAQARLYDGLTPLFDRVTPGDLTRFFKSAGLGLGPDGPGRVERVPRAGVRIVRDRFNVPHIRGRTRDDVTWASGWVMQEDRGQLLQQARGAARVAAIDVPGVTALSLITSLRTFVPSAQTEREVAKQTGVLRRAGPKGRAVLHDIDVYLRGLNARLRAEDSSNPPFTRNDIYALNGLKGQFVGQGGGDEARRSMLLDGLRDRLGAARGARVWDDLRERDDPEHLVTLPGRAPYGARRGGTNGSVALDDGSYEPVRPVPAAASAASATARPTEASNILMLAGRRSTNGRPLFVGGPQIGYFYPGLVLELDLKGPGIEQRGVSAAPFPGYVFIGRGPDFAWTLTSASGDIIDQYAETLCEGSETKYLYRGRCREMGTFTAGVLRGTPDTTVAYRTTVHGPVVGYGTVDGRRVAISSKRSSRGRDALDLLPYRELRNGQVRGPRQFIRSYLQSPQTFNAFYADARSIAMVTTGRLPRRAPGVEPGLPTIGDGRFEWRGFLSGRGHPQSVNPSTGMIVNWNNKPIRGFRSADNSWNLGAVHRGELLTDGVAARRRHTLASVVGVANAAATQDLRVRQVWPTIRAVLATGAAPSPRAARMADLVDAWRRAGGSRLDRELDGRIDDPGAAILDAAWARMADAALAPVLGPQLEALDDLIPRFDAPPNGQGSAWAQYLDKDLRRLLGRRVRGAYSERYCGAGDLAACRAALWAALEAAGGELEAAQGPDPAAWRADANRERIRFAPGLLPYTMRYTNRPSGIHQVMTFTSRGR